MRTIFLFFVLALLFSNRVFAADFKVTAPREWKKVSVEGDNALYQNSFSKHHEAIALRSFRVVSTSEVFQENLQLHAKEVEQARAEVMQSFGLVDYTVISVDRIIPKNAKFRFAQEIQSRYLDLSGIEVQTLERQYVSHGKMYVVTYLLDAPALNNRERAHLVLDYFLPVNSSSREIASAKEIVTAVGSSAARTGTSQLGQKAPLLSELDMKDPKSADTCSAVPLEKRRTAQDLTFMGQLESTLKIPGNCFMGVYDNIWGMISGVGDVLLAGVKYANPFSSEFRDQANSAVGTIASEAWKNPKDFSARIGSTVASFISKSVGNFFQCLKPEAQVRAVCNLAVNLLPQTVLLKLVTKAPLAAQELALAAKLAKEAVGADKIKLAAPVETLAARTAAQKIPEESGFQLNKNVKGIYSVPSAAQIALPTEFVKTLKSSEGAKNLASMLNDGDDLAIEVGHYSKNFEKTGTLENIAGRGEAIQAVFTAKVLHELLPKAKILESGSGPLEAEGRVHLRIGIEDLAERGVHKSPLAQNANLEMPDVKLANPGPGKMDKSTLREALGIPKDSRVLSLNNSIYNEPGQVRQLVQAIAKEKPNVIIVSQSFMEPEGPQNLIQTLNFIKDGYITKKLSSLNGDPLDPTKKYIFVNDTNGRMHGVYGVADANVVAGAVNLSEPLLANTPTVFFDHTSDYMHNYNAADFKKMADQAQATGGAFAVDGIASMNQKLSEVLSTTKPANIAPPYSVKLDGQTTPVDNYVSALTRSLGEAANKEDAFSKAHIPAAGLKVYVRSKLSQLEEIARTIESPEVPLEKKTLAAAAFKTHTFSPGILSALSPEELKALKNTSARLRTEAVKIASQNPDFATQAAQVLVRTDRLLSKKSGRAGISKETLNFIEDLKKRNAISEKSVQELEKLMN